jgi:hypothetical protein
VLPSMHFQLRWLGLTDSFCHGGYYIGDGRYGGIRHQLDRRASGQENLTVWNAKLDHPIS